MRGGPKAMVPRGLFTNYYKVEETKSKTKGNPFSRLGVSQ
jgi:hypothetical protein